MLRVTANELRLAALFNVDPPIDSQHAVCGIKVIACNFISYVYVLPKLHAKKRNSFLCTVIYTHVCNGCTSVFVCGCSSTVIGSLHLSMPARRLCMLYRILINEAALKAFPATIPN